MKICTAIWTQTQTGFNENQTVLRHCLPTQFSCLSMDKHGIDLLWPFGARDTLTHSAMQSFDGKIHTHTHQAIWILQSQPRSFHLSKRTWVLKFQGCRDLPYDLIFILAFFLCFCLSFIHTICIYTVHTRTIDVIYVEKLITIMHVLFEQPLLQLKMMSERVSEWVWDKHLAFCAHKIFRYTKTVSKWHCIWYITSDRVYIIIDHRLTHTHAYTQSPYTATRQ